MMELKAAARAGSQSSWGEHGRGQGKDSVRRAENSVLSCWTPVSSSFSESWQFPQMHKYRCLLVSDSWTGDPPAQRHHHRTASCSLHGSRLMNNGDVREWFWFKIRNNSFLWGCVCQHSALVNCLQTAQSITMSTPLFIVSCLPGCLLTTIRYFKNTSGIKGENKKRNKGVVGDKCITNLGAFASEIGKMSGAGWGMGGIRFFQSSRNITDMHGPRRLGDTDNCALGVSLWGMMHQADQLSTRWSPILEQWHDVNFTTSMLNTYYDIHMLYKYIIILENCMTFFKYLETPQNRVEITALSENNFTFGCW